MCCLLFCWNSPPKQDKKPILGLLSRVTWSVVRDQFFFCLQILPFWPPLSYVSPCWITVTLLSSPSVFFSVISHNNKFGFNYHLHPLLEWVSSFVSDFFKSLLDCDCFMDVGQRWYKPFKTNYFTIIINLKLNNIRNLLLHSWKFWIIRTIINFLQRKEGRKFSKQLQEEALVVLSKWRLSQNGTLSQWIGTFWLCSNMHSVRILWKKQAPWFINHEIRQNISIWLHRYEQQDKGSAASW
jgi:hypothetical protein